MQMLKYLLAWFPMLLLAVINGGIREAIFKEFVSGVVAHQLSTITLIAFFGLYFWFIFSRYPPASGQQALLIGFAWLIITLAFEFGFGRFRGNSWSALLGEYNLFRGKLWVLIPIWVALAPYLFYRLLHR